jgi:glycosyltransferase involved in cell wall biosynthesis
LVPLISVVIPVYNGELTIRETVESVLNQTFSDFELIIINDGSSDSTLDILGEFEDPRLKIFSYLNSGLAASRNRGILHACGELISFIDADDLWTSNKLESQLNAIRGHPHAAVAYSWTDFVDQRGNLLGYGIHRTVNGSVFSRLLEFFFIGSGSNALIRRSVFDEVGQFDETLTSAEDLDMFLRLAARYQFSAVPEPQILYRISENSMSRNVIRQEKETLKVLDRAFAQEPGKSFIRLKRVTYANLYLYLASNVLRGAPDRQKGLMAIRFIWRALISAPFILGRIRQVATLVFKAISVLFLNPERARSLRARIKSVMDK